ncbi:MAG: ribosome recycling factor [Bacilli bacterium]|nr:ribosome recycling factor [Bacilli bacterium]
MDILDETKLSMEKTIANLRGTLNTLRTGRASAALLDNLYCDYYGDKMKVNQIAAVKVPEPRQLLVIPYDANDIRSIVAAINKSDIGINPIVDGKQIRLNMPPLTEDRRKELAKKAKVYGEEAKVAIRNIRRDAMDFIKEDDSYTEDTRKREEADLQKLTDEFIKSIDSIVKEKDAEIMAV